MLQISSVNVEIINLRSKLNTFVAKCKVYTYSEVPLVRPPMRGVKAKKVYK